MAGVLICFVISFTLFVTLGRAFEARERERRRACSPSRGAAARP